MNIMTALSFEELHNEQVELLPSRETLGVWNYANVTANNLALAQNAATFWSAAHASAHQNIYVWQG